MNRPVNIAVIFCPLSSLLHQTVVVMTDKNHRQFEGTATSSKGKTTNIRLKEGKKPNGHLRNVKVGGLPEPTNAVIASCSWF